MHLAENQGAGLIFPGHETELRGDHESEVLFTQQYHMF